MKLLGLKKYEYSDFDSFIGRDKSIESGLDILKKTKILIINGSEGSGKSSFIESGILKRIKAGFNGNAGRHWAICTLRPGISPINNLCRSLSSSESLYLNSKPKTSDFSHYKKIINQKGSNAIIEIYKKSEIFNKKNLLIIVDQVEDLYKYSKFFDYEHSLEDDLLINMIYNSVKNDYCSIYFILGIQNNSLSKLNLYGKFSELLSLGQYNIPKLNVKEFYSKIKYNLNFEISEEIIPKIQHLISENPHLLTNFQHLLKKFNSFEFLKEKLLSKEMYIESGGLKNVICNDLNFYLEKQNKKTKNYLNKILRILNNADDELKENFFQNFKTTREYLNISQKDLTNLLMKVNQEFGEIFDIVEKDISGTKSLNNYVVKDDDIITLKYPNSLNWDTLKNIQKEEIEIYNICEKFVKTLEEGKELEIDEIDEGIKIINKDYINEEWSKKYTFDYNTIKELIIREKNRYEKRKKIAEEKLKRDIRMQMIFRRGSYIVGLFLLFAFGYIIFKNEEYNNAKKAKEIALERYYDSKQDLDSLLKLDKQLEQELDKREVDIIEANQNLEIKQQKIQILQDSIILGREIISGKQEDLDLERNDNKRLRKNIQKQIEMFSENSKLQSIRREGNALAKEIKLFTDKDDKTELTKKANQAYDLYNSYVKIYNQLIINENRSNLNKSNDEFTLDSSERNEIISNLNDDNIDFINIFRRLGNNIITKYYGVNDITELSERNLLKDFKKSTIKLNQLLISNERKIFTAGDSKMLIYSEENKSKLDSLSFSDFRLESEIESIALVNSDVLFAGLRNGEIWYLSLSRNLKTRIFPKRNRNLKPVFKLIYDKQKLYSFDNDILIIYDLNSRTLKEVKIPIKKGDYFRDIAIDNSNYLFLSTLRGDIIELNIDKINNMSRSIPSHTLIFDSSTSPDLSYNDKVNRIEFISVSPSLKKNKPNLNNKLVFSTINGWVFSCIRKNGRLEITERFIADNSKIEKLKYDTNSGFLFTCAIDGSFSAFDTSFENFWKYRVDLQLSPKNSINDALVFKSENESYLITASENGNLSYFQLDLEEIYDDINKFIIKKN